MVTLLLLRNKQPWAKVIILADSRSTRRALAFRLRGLGNRKNRLDHRQTDSRAVSSCVCQLLSDSNNFLYGYYFVVICVYYYTRGCDGIQPERLNAEGDSPSALSRGLSVSATPGAVSPLEKRLKDANVAAKEADFRVFQTHHGRCYDTEGFASLPPRLRATRSARAFDLSGRAAVKLVIVSLSKAVHPD